jgi:hypothetical protein
MSSIAFSTVRRPLALETTKGLLGPGAFWGNAPKAVVATLAAVVERKARRFMGAFRE